MMFSFLLLYYKEYRNVLSFRISGKVKQNLFDFLFPGVESILIITPKNMIGENLQLGHRTSIILSAKKVGKNFLLYQQTTIGAGKGGNPTIGDNVTVYAGAKIIGGITIGDNVIVGANAAVVKDVPDNAVVGGIPAKIIKYNTPKT